MAKNLTKSGITSNGTIEAWHVTQSIDAFTGQEAYNINLSGSLDVIGSISGSFTGSLQGTSSYSQNSLTSSYITPKYKIYVALLTQTGTSAPVATILENTLGFTPFISYSSPGVYLYTSSAGFPTNKTAFFPGVAFGGTGGNIEFDIDYGTPNDIYFYTRDNTGTNVNGLLKTTPIEIRVYP